MVILDFLKSRLNVFAQDHGIGAIFCNIYFPLKKG